MRLRSLGLVAVVAAGLLDPISALAPLSLATDTPAQEPELVYSKERSTLGVSLLQDVPGDGVTDKPWTTFQATQSDWPKLPQDAASRAGLSMLPAVAAVADSSALAAPTPRGTGVPELGTAVETRSDAEGQDLYFINSDGAETRVTCSPEMPKNHPVFSAKTGLLAYSAFDGKHWQLWLAKFKQNDPDPCARYSQKQLTFGDFDNTWPSWIPGLDYLVFSSTRDDPLASIYALKATDLPAGEQRGEPLRLSSGGFADSRPSVGRVGYEGSAAGSRAAGASECPGCFGTMLWLVFSSTRYRTDGSLVGTPLVIGQDGTPQTDPGRVHSLWALPGDGVLPGESAQSAGQNTWQSDEAAWEPGLGGGVNHRIAFSSKRSDPAGDIFQTTLAPVGTDWSDARLVADSVFSVVADRPGVAESHPVWNSAIRRDTEDRLEGTLSYTMRKQDSDLTLGPLKGGSGLKLPGVVVSDPPGKDPVGANAHDPVFGPDGQQLIWSQRGKAGARALGHLDRIGPGAKPTLPEIPGAMPNDELGEPAISPDGKLLAFTRRAAGSARTQIWLGELDSSGAVSNARELKTTGNLGQDFADASPSFSPDGKKIMLARSYWGADPALSIVDDTRVIPPPAFAQDEVQRQSEGQGRGWLGRTTVGVHVKNSGDQGSEPTTVELNSIRYSSLPWLAGKDIQNIPASCRLVPESSRLLCDVPALAAGEDHYLSFVVVSGFEYGFRVFGRIVAQAGDEVANNQAVLDSPYVKQDPGNPIPPEGFVPAAAPASIALPPPAPGQYILPRPQLWQVNLANQAAQPIRTSCAQRADSCPIVNGASPSWGPAGMVAFVDDDALKTAIVNSEGRAAEINQLTGIGADGKQPTPSRAVIERAEDPAWSVDGKELLFAGQPAGQPSNRGIYAVNASDGGGLRTIAQTPFEETEPVARPVKATDPGKPDPGKPDPAKPKPIDPKAGDLRISLTLDANQAWLGGKTVKGSVQISNDSDLAAKDLVLELSNTAEANALELKIEAPGCQESRCALGELAARQSRTVAFRLRPQAKGQAELNAQISSSSAERDLRNNSAQGHVTVRETTVRLLPSVAKAGEVVLAYIENMPPGDTVRLGWDQGIYTGAESFSTPTDNMTIPVLILPGDQLGERKIRVHSIAGQFGGTDGISGDLLVVPSAIQPPGYVGRN